MERGKEEKTGIELGLNDLLSKMERERECLQRKIREAALTSDGRLRTGSLPKIKDDQADLLFSEMTMLIWDYKRFMDIDGLFQECQKDIDGKLTRAMESIFSEIRNLGMRLEKNSITSFADKAINSLLQKLQKELRTEMEKCLKRHPNRIPKEEKEIVLDMFCLSSQSEPWLKRQDALTKRIVVLYAKYTPLKKKDGKINVSGIAQNLVLIFKACDISDIGEEDLRKRIASIHTI